MLDILELYSQVLKKLDSFIHISSYQIIQPAVNC